MFNPKRLTLARRRRGLTKTKLAEEAKLTLRSVSAFEAGDLVPSRETLDELARILKFPIMFFSAPTLVMPSPKVASFRSLSSMTARQRDSALGAGALAIEFAEWLEARFNLPIPALPDFTGHDPETTAITLRAEWGLGERPIKNMVHLLEAKGVRVFSLVQECKEIDAFSLWRNGTPYVFLNTVKSGERSRFDAAHELGHLVLHRHGGPQGRSAEGEANAFASAFLMPASSVRAHRPLLPTLETLIQLKSTWKVSVGALVYRLFGLRLLSEWQYRTLCVECAKRGYRTSEPNGITRETSLLLHKVFQSLKEEGVTKTVIAEQLHTPPAEIDSLVFGLVMTLLPGSQKGSGSNPDVPRTTGHLKLLS